MAGLIVGQAGGRVGKELLVRSRTLGRHPVRLGSGEGTAVAGPQPASYLPVDIWPTIDRGAKAALGAPFDTYE